MAIGEVIAIGSEILSGRTVNSHATWLSRELGRVGVKVAFHQVVGDVHKQIREAVELAFSRSDVVVVTGGLGPTQDDRTREVLVELFGGELRCNEEVLADLKERFGSKKISLVDQATVPDSAVCLLNKVGTAPGLLFQREEKVAFFIPGVPSEMRALALDGVIPYLKNRIASAAPLQREIHLIQVAESEVDSIATTLMKRYPGTEIGSYPGYGTLTLLITSLSKEAISGCERAVMEAYPGRVFEAGSGSIVEAIHRLFTDRNLTLSSAESCTGGAIAAALTALPGASTFYRGSIISYTNEIKQSLLNVSRASLDAHGAVSEEVVKEMATGVVKAIGSTYGVATSGVAGPDGGSAEKPVGTVWTAIAHESGEVVTRKLQLHGSRESIIGRTVGVVLGDMWRMIHG